MVEKGLLVTVVLDCCFSGSVLRTGNVQGAGIRSVDYDHAIAAATPPEHQDYFGSRGVDYPLRDSTTPRDKWIVNPDGYTVLSACGPHETAHELKVSNGEQRGALSYFLMEALSALRKRGVDITHESLYEYMRIRFHASWPRQTPMRYGNRSFSFFDGPANTSGTPFVQVYEKDNGLHLDAGEAHGVHEGDTYVLSPPGWRGDAGSQCGFRQASMTELTRRGLLKTGAICISCISDDDGEACMFNVVLDDQGRYDIRDGLEGTIANLPAIPANAQGAEQQLMDTLQHLSKFKYAEGIENRIPDTSFEMLFSLVSSVDGGEPSNSSVFDVEHGRTWQLEIENKGETALYFALFNFTPSWKIENLLSESGHNGFWVLEPKSKEVLPLAMEVPEFVQGDGTEGCEDIIKVFITNRATSFPSMILPELPLYGLHNRGQPHEAGDELLALITGLIGSVRGNDAGHEKWATRNFIIRTNTKMT
ncbi:hypothetical protein TsFJ059_006563 [Trichoderma semiorbis]|uniref:Uncharacterized protein n=1 Tax=Trichoderma semiorbis TaxID=1491008 RepID=A0A9P8HJQ6_9HYPO|nr:hypothetical protein TsFJ059_006563 [Trichoderma semiorbis]